MEEKFSWMRRRSRHTPAFYYSSSISNNNNNMARADGGGGGSKGRKRKSHPKKKAGNNRKINPRAIAVDEKEIEYKYVKALQRYILNHGGPVDISQLCLGYKTGITRPTSTMTIKFKTLLEKYQNTLFSLEKTGEGSSTSYLVNAINNPSSYDNGDDDNDDADDLGGDETNENNIPRAVAANEKENEYKYVKALESYILNHGRPVDMRQLASFNLTGIARPTSRVKTKFKALLEKYQNTLFSLEQTGEGSSTSYLVHAIIDPSSYDNDDLQDDDANEICRTPTTATRENRGVKFHYFTNTSQIAKMVKDILDDPYKFIALDLNCDVKGDGCQWIVLASEHSVYCIDCHHMDNMMVGEEGPETAYQMLVPILANEATVKLVYNVARFCSIIVVKVAHNSNNFGESALLMGRPCSSILDIQLLAESMYSEPFMELHNCLSRLGVPAFFDDEGGYSTASSRKVLRLQWAAKYLIAQRESMHELQTATQQRIQYGIQNEGRREICFDKTNNYQLISSELVQSAIRPNSQPTTLNYSWGEPLVVECNIDEVRSVLPIDFTMKLLSTDEHLQSSLIQQLPLEELHEIVLDLGRPPYCWIGSERHSLCDDESVLVTRNDLQRTNDGLGNFGSDNRAGMNGSLHRFAAMRNRSGEMMGITIRIGRHIKGNAAMIMDLLIGSNKSILFLGEPGSGKSTIIRDATCKLAHRKSVIVVDTSNEIAGDGETPHDCIGLARRMMVPHLDTQYAVMVEAVQNHTPHVMVVDEIGRSKEVDAARTVKQRGVRMIASAHGDFRRLLKNKDLVGLVGGIESVTMGDGMAKEEAIRKQKLAGKAFDDSCMFPVNKTKVHRRGEPTFEVIVEISRESRHDWRIITDSARAVDSVLDGLPYQAQLRTRDPATGSIRVKAVAV